MQARRWLTRTGWPQLAQSAAKNHPRRMAQNVRDRIDWPLKPGNLGQSRAPTGVTVHEPSPDDSRQI